MLEFLIGATSALGIAPFAEWAVHKYIMHQPPSGRTNKLMRDASIGHQDDHHQSYRAPHHYYRDATNEKSVIHFSPKYVGLIAGVSTGVGLIVSAGIDYISEKYLNTQIPILETTAGFATGIMAHYAAYEITHHQMHVLGEKRQKIIESLEQKLYQKVPSDQERLRLSKPLVDDICEVVMRGQEISEGLEKRYEEQRRVSSTRGAKYSELRLQNLVDYARVMIKNSPPKGIEKVTSMAVEALRKFPLFKYMDNHHFLHHAHMGCNFNMVWPVADWLFKTQAKGKIAELEHRDNYAKWISI